MARKPTGKPNGRPYATNPAPNKAAERARAWRLANPEKSRVSALARRKKQQVTPQ